MITPSIANSLTQRALAAYFRGQVAGSTPMQPGQTEAVEHDGKWYIVLANVHGVLAVYRIREVNGEPVLKGLKRWPKEVAGAFE